MRMKDSMIDNRICIDAELQRRADHDFEEPIHCEGCERLYYEDEMSHDPDNPQSAALFCEDCLPPNEEG